MGNGRVSLLLLGAAAMMVSADARVIDPLLKIISSEFDVAIPTAAWLVTAYTFPYGLCQLLFGTLGDRYGKVRVMANALLVFAVGTGICGLVGLFPLLLILRFVTGVAAAAVIPMSLSYIGDKVPVHERQVALGRFMSSLMLGQILSATLGGFFGERIGWRVLFFVLGTVAAVVALVLLKEAARHPEPAAQSATSLTTFTRLASTARARRVLGAVFVEGCFVFGTLAFLAATMKERFPQLGHDVIGLGLAFYGVGGITYSLTVKKLVPLFGEKGIVLLGGTLISLGCALHAFLPVWGLFPVAMVLFGMGYVTLHGTLQTHATELDPKARATAVSLFAFLFFLGQAVGPVLMGHILSRFGVAPAFSVAAIGLFTLALWVRFAIARPRPAKP
jgi:YNFM family putative membrane transporter